MTGMAAAMLGLGAVHGINPGMGWLFAVGLGLQEQDRRAVWRAILPLAAGHALAIAGAVAAGTMLGAVVPVAILERVVAVALLGLGIERLVRGRHPRWVGMRVSARDLTLWSMLMTSAHGAGLMALPFVLGGSARPELAGEGHHAIAAGASAVPYDGLVATGLHSAGYLIATALVAAVVYEKLGLPLLGRLWINLDVLWGVALIVTALLTSLA